MAKQGILAKSKPSGATNTLLYSAPVDASASTVLTVNEQGGSGTTYDVALKNYDQKMTLGSSSYLLHEVTPVTMSEDKQGKGLGRYSISNFMQRV